MKNFFSLSGKTAFISGANGYLGKSMAEGLAESGALVYLNGRDGQKIDSLVKEFEQKNLNVKPAVFDITNQEDVQEFFSKLDEPFIDVIVNNAYCGVAGSIETSSTNDYASSYDIAMTSTHHLVQCALPYLRNAVKINGDASVINIASMYGMVSPDLRIYESKSVSNPPFYGAAKAALIQWSKYAACEFASEGIRFNAISPGPFPSNQAPKSLVSKIENKVPMARIGNPSELIGPLLFLASSSSSFVTGINLPVDGGWTAW